MKIRLFLLPLTFLLLGGGLVRADPVTIELNPNPVCVLPGTCSLVTVTVTNSSNAPLTITTRILQPITDTAGDWNFSFTVDQFDEFDALRGELAPGAKKIFHFSVCLGPGAPGNSVFLYEVKISYTLDNGQSTETSALGVAKVPEPTTMLLLSTGLAGLAIKTRKRLKSRKLRQGR